MMGELDTAARAVGTADARAGMVPALFTPPGWLAFDRGDRLEVLELFGGEQLELRGAVREALLSGDDAGAALASLAVLQPALARLRDSLAEQPLRALDRATLLRGVGFGQLFLELTARCNERCRHCYAESSPERQEALDRETVWAVLDDARALGFAQVQLTGGDPLVSALCAPAAQRARELGLAVEVYTNGLALGGTLYERLRAAGVGFAFSFYSHDAAVHDGITRTPGSQRRTLEAIARVFADGLRARVNVIVMDDNREHLEATVALLESRGVPREQMGMDVQRTVGRGLMTIRPKDSGIEATGVGAPLGGHKQQSAQPFAGRAAVSYDGNVYPCIFSRDYLLGSLGDRSLRAILEEPVPLGVDATRLLADYDRHEAALACWDCRLRAAVLSGSR